MKTFIIIHGWDGDSRIGWFKWLKIELEKRGYKVLTPQLPNHGEPQIKPWVDKIFEISKNTDENTYFLGHSIGCQAILRYLEKYNVKIGGAIFVAGWFDLKEETFMEDPKTEKEARRIAKPWITNKINTAKIRLPKGKSFAIFSDNDKFVDEKPNSKIFKDKLGCQIIIEHDKKHYEESKTREIPVILDILDRLEEIK
ncbi:MAG TPA: alpha/beta fold hydrolase [Alphaproteobacteria bacterium]|nr:alpha/beta fold hydrolase [Alphaproteobacteria bacterium]